ncbi:cytochrome P450 [Streptomyces sp. NPDC088090]|uniref:cytochrome P450 family protein n=1 Tax=Streptomyces sp. NPDC088090 TaxID=3365822 RepID=UPI00384C9DCB
MSPQTEQPMCPFAIDPLGRDIHAETAAIRSRGTAARIELPGGVPAWSVTGYEACRRLLADPRLSKDPEQHWPAWISGEVDTGWSLSMWVTIRSMFTAYGSEHARLRGLVASSFTARRTEAMRPAVERITAELLDRLAAFPPGHAFDLRTEFATPLPARIVCELFGVPEESSGEMCALFDRLFDTSTETPEVQRCAERLYALLSGLVEAKRRAPGPDLTSALVHAQQVEQRCDERELLDTLVHLLSAGFETTVNLIDHAVHALLTHPDQLALVRSGAVSWQDVVEETLRWQPPAAHLMLRYAVEDIDLGDVLIPRGDAVVISVAGAGRDPETHGADADAFDVTRPTRRGHLSFGHGAHHCLGAPLARMEAAVALSRLFERFPGLALAAPSDTLRPLASFISNGHRELPVTTGGARPGRPGRQRAGTTVPAQRTGARTPSPTRPGVPAAR